MNLTSRQITAIQSGEPVRLVPPEVGSECVMVRADVYDRVKHLLYDDSEWSTDELRHLLAHAADSIGWNEPAMDAYDRFRDENNESA